MADDAAAKLFRGGVPDAYEQLMVPLMFQPYADDMVARAVARGPSAVLELAAGTGAVTRGLAAALPRETTLIATDLNPGMLAVAEARGAPRPAGAPDVRWQTADAQALPFDDASFDLVVCQFGVMFFPDRPAAHAQVRRVLRPGGTYLFSAWDSIKTNAVALAVDEAYRRVLPDAPPNVITRVAHGYHDPGRIRADAEAGGLIVEAIEAVELVGVAESAAAAAAAIPHGSPMRAELEPLGDETRARIEAITAELLAQRFGAGPIRTPIRAFVVTARR
ncbi:class I SAM-dependent methyltransferase [Microbacterium azadirachtae]|uniref:Demethylmenaquinone methyltransferase n=1 Tax=Microbacterium azadirachtae TaxID=582680 RepID=A0A0F0LJL0_9MICO|nr:class I SAM-dependent methyltransferase [Microbacterium azadirachtae]KJL33318.1 Demethylmenaquinone methyltransferase [Microbacterium azadirachtae]